nr:MAG TPA: single-stranded-DNA-specific exonuclease RecJ [Caudoviricetes sp.]
MKWKPKNYDTEEIKKYMNTLNVSNVMASVLIGLGIDLKTARTLMNDPTDLFDVESSIYGLKEVASSLLKQKERIIQIFADYDVDGLSSGFILNDYLKNILNYDSNIYYPSREDGYGVNINWAKDIVEKYDPDNLTVITVDNGITAHEPVQILRDAGAQVYIIDHHEPLDSLPDANCICDAWVDRGYGTHLCAAAVVWKLVLEMSVQNGDNHEQINDVMYAYLPYVALATISDVMPSNLENRAIMQAGLEAINQKQSSVLRSLMNAENINFMRSKDLAWTIAPMLNACSRMNEIEMAEKLLNREGNYDEDIKTLASKIREINRKRKMLTEKAVEEILKKSNFGNAPVVFADGTNYPLGIIGILAGKLCEITWRPAIVYQVKGDIAEGSARSLPGIDIKEIVNYEAAKGNAIIALGHAEACGVQIIPSRIREFNRDLLSSIISYTMINEPKEEIVLIDAVISPSDISFKNKRELDSFGYTSKDIPVLGLLDVEVKPRIWKTASGKKHVIFELPDSKYAVAWNGYDIYHHLGEPERMNFAGELDNGAFCRYCKEVSITEHTTIFTISRMGKA